MSAKDPNYLLIESGLKMDDAAALAMLNASLSELRAFSDDEWRSLVQYVLDHLQAYLGGRIVTKPIETCSVGEGFCLQVWSAMETPDSPMHWKGILGATIVDGKLYVSLTVFLYSLDRRLFTSDGSDGKDGRDGPDGSNGREFLEYALDVSANNECRWKLLGWFNDVYGEYDYYLSP